MPGLRAAERPHRGHAVTEHVSARKRVAAMIAPEPDLLRLTGVLDRLVDERVGIIGRLELVVRFQNNIAIQPVVV